MRGNWGIFSRAPGFCRNRGRQKVRKNILKNPFRFSFNEQFLSVLRNKQSWASVRRHHELALCTSTPWGIWFLTSFTERMPSCWGDWSATQKMTKQMTPDEMGVPSSRHKDSEHCAALPSLLQPAQAAHTTAELLWGRPAPGREKITKETWTDHPRLMMEKSENTCERKLSLCQNHY